MLYMSSRRTICDGEVVTFATEFKEHDGPFGGHDAAGPFEVSASREGVMVHRACCRDAEQSELLVQAVGQAERVRENLADTWRGGAQSRYPAQPTLCMPPNSNYQER
jgi:hypothetical protein